MPIEPFKPPKDILPGSQEEKAARLLTESLGLEFDLADHNRIRAWAAYKAWHKRAMDERDHELGYVKQDNVPSSERPLQDVPYISIRRGENSS